MTNSYTAPGFSTVSLSLLMAGKVVNLLCVQQLMTLRLLVHNAGTGAAGVPAPAAFLGKVTDELAADGKQADKRMNGSMDPQMGAELEHGHGVAHLLVIPRMAVAAHPQDICFLPMPDGPLGLRSMCKGNRHRSGTRRPH